jgi:hypothetical protein
MDARFEAILADQLGSGLPGLAGSDARVTLRIAERLLDDIIRASMPAGGTVKTLTVAPRAGDVFDVSATLKSAWVQPLHARLEIERQPALPDDPVLVLRLTGGAGGLLKLAGGFLATALPPFVRLDGDRLLVDVRALAAHYGQSSLLRYARILRVTTDDGVMVVTIVAAARTDGG